MATGFRLSAPDEYRRGVVLGLTLAEVLLLLAFLLLLTMTALLLRKERERAELRDRSERDTRIVQLVEKAALGQGMAIDDDRLANLIRDGAQADSLRSQLREARQQADAAAKAVAENKALAAVLEQVPGTPSGTLAGKAEHLADAAAKQAVEDKAVAAVLERFPGTPPGTLAQKFTYLVTTTQNLTGQNNQMRNELARVKGNGGSGLPYCWAMPDGKPQYMLKVDMHDDGVIVYDVEPRVRPDDPAWGVLNPIGREQPMPLEDFMSQVAPLKTSETADRCLYAIQVVDSTGRTNKIGYKHSMGRLWTVFHLQEIH